MSYLICKEIFCDKTSVEAEGRVFRFPADPNNGDIHYRSRQATNAFFFNPRRRRNVKGKTLYYAQWEEDFEISEKVWRNTCKKHDIPYREPSIIELNSVFEFFAAIGFDNKTKKYHANTKRVSQT